MADFLKFLVTRPDRKRKRKPTVKAKRAPAKAEQAPAAVSDAGTWGTPAGNAAGDRGRYEGVNPGPAKKPDDVPPQAQLVVVPNVSRPLEAKEIVMYQEGDVIPPNSQILAVWKDASGEHQKDVTALLKKQMGLVMRELKDHKEGKSKAEEDAKREREAKDKAEQAKELAAAEAKKAKEEQSKSDAKSLKVLEEKLEHEAYTKTMAIWSKMSASTVVTAAKAAGVKSIYFPRGHKNAGKARPRETLVASAIAIGKKRYAAAKTYEEIKKVTDENKILDEYIMLLEDMKKQPDGYYDQGGKGRSRLDRSTSNTELDKAMSQVPGFQKTVASDDDFEVKGTPNPKGVSWVMNLDKSGQPGSHWVAVLITPHSVEYSDSFGDHPSPSVQERIVAAGKRLWPENVKTLKINKIKRQAENSSTCGFHAMKFIRDRMSGKSFVDSTGYGNDRAASQVRAGEKGVAEFERKYPKFVQVGKGILDHPGNNMPDAVKRMLEAHGEEAVSSLTVIRTPVQSAISTVLNVVTLGAFKAALAKYNYDQLFHLAIEVNSRYVIEKNATVQFKPGSRSGGDRKQAAVPAGVKVKDLFKRGTSEGFWLYDPRTNNCQDFIVTVLAGVGALTSELRAFVKQDAVSVFASMPSYAGKLAKLVTDLGGRFDGVKDKIGKFFRGRGTPAEGAQKTIAEMNRSMAESSRSLEQEAKRRGITLNDQKKTPPGLMVAMLRRLGIKGAAKAFHKWDTGEELEGGKRGFTPDYSLLTSGSIRPVVQAGFGAAEAIRYGNKGPYSWNGGVAPVAPLRKQSLTP